jgi:hypothetical protein
MAEKGRLDQGIVLQTTSQRRDTRQWTRSYTNDPAILDVLLHGDVIVEVGERCPVVG